MLFELTKGYPGNVVVSCESIYNESGGKLPFGYLLKALTDPKNETLNYFIVSKVLVLITFLVANMEEINTDDRDKIFLWIAEALENNTNNRIKLIVMTCLSVLVKKNSLRTYFEEHRRIVKHLTKNVEYKDDTIEQIMYQTLNTLWILTYNKKVRQKLTKRKMVINLCQILHKVTKPKILRLSLSLLRNILHEGDNGEVMIGSGIIDTFSILNGRKEQFGDEDMIEDLSYLEESLIPIMDKMSSFDRFKHEILSGKLDPTAPSHKSERFWRENFARFEENSYEVLKKLKEIIDNPDKAEDPRKLALACWDIGEFVRFHPRGKAIIEQIDCKVPIMKLLNHESEKVKGEALLALQKVMVTNWEYLNQS